MSSVPVQLDNTDREALAFLASRGRATWAQLGQLLGLSPPAAADRVRKLEQMGVIQGYAALVDAPALGYPLLAYVLVTLGNQRHRVAFLKAIGQMTEIVECHHVAGDGDYLLKVHCKGTLDLDRILVEEFKDRLNIVHSRTTIVLSTAKATTSVAVLVSEKRPQRAGAAGRKTAQTLRSRGR
jgi:Lrp/AsnC family leucine-responsive transcriptional regulator